MKKPAGKAPFVLPDSDLAKLPADNHAFLKEIKQHLQNDLNGKDSGWFQLDYLNGVQMQALNPNKRKIQLDKVKILLWVLGCFLMYFYLRWYLNIVLIIAIGKVLDVKLLVPSIKITKKFDSLVKGRTIIPLSPHEIVTRMIQFYKGSHSDHFDSMIKDIS